MGHFNWTKYYCCLSVWVCAYEYYISICIRCGSSLVFFSSIVSITQENHLESLSNHREIGSIDQSFRFQLNSHWCESSGILELGIYLYVYPTWDICIHNKSFNKPFVFPNKLRICESVRFIWTDIKYESAIQLYTKTKIKYWLKI